MAFMPLFDVAVEDVGTSKAPTVQEIGTALKKARTRQPRKTPKKDLPRGCEPCPLNKVHGVHKLMGEMHGRKRLVFALSPGPEDNSRRKLLVTDSARLLWKELKRVGIERSDCDVQYTVRCFTADETQGYNGGSYLKMRNPHKEETRCCSLHTENALKQSKAKQILVLGLTAAKTLLQTRSLPGQKIFWSDKLNARIYIVDHPSFFLRGYGTGEKFDHFRRILKQFADDGVMSRKQMQDRFAYVRSKDYRLVQNKEQAVAAEKILMQYVAQKKRVAFDIEYRGDDVICCGFCPKPGLTFVFVWKHADIKKSDGADVLKVARRLLESSHVWKAAHYGCSDVSVLLDKMKIETGGYTDGHGHDTNLSEYLRFSDKKKYGLDELMETRFPKFSGYSLVVVEDMLKGVELPPKIAEGTIEDRYKYINSKNLFDVSKLSLDALRLYNGADCDLCKRLEIDNKPHVPQALMNLYIDLSFLLYKMEPNGPFYDYEQHEKLEAILPFKAKALKRRLRKILKRKKFNPGSPAQVLKALYSQKYLGLEYPFPGKPNTTKKTLLMLGRESKFPNLLLEWRMTAREVSTLESYKQCANANAGRLRTRWWATNARTGRLSSGGSKNKKKGVKVINLQNIKKASHVQNLVLADKRWPRVYRASGRLLRRFAPEVLRYWRACEAAEVAAKAKGRKKAEYPKPSAEYVKQLQVVAKKIERWIRRNMPDLKVFLILDYGQVEVRVAAQMSGDKNLLKDCAKGDIHTQVGVAMTGWDAERIANDPQTRTLTKNVHFGILFGIGKQNLFSFVLAMSPPDMRDRITEEEVSAAYDRYFERYPGIRRFIEKQREFAKEHGFVSTMFGMIQTLNITEDQFGEDEAAEYADDEEMGGRKAYWGNQAINGPVQGSAHQLLICAMVNLLRQVAKYEMLGIPPMEVHDALYFFTDLLGLGSAVKKAKYLLEQESLNTVKSDFPDIDWKVPIAVDCEAGLSLGCKIDVDEKSSAGLFMVNWYKKRRKQILEINRELEGVLAA